MSNHRNNVISASLRFTRGATDTQEVDQQTRDGERVLKTNYKFKLSMEERETIARNIGHCLHNYGIQRQSLADTAACQKHNIDPKELYRLVVGREEDQVAPTRLRASFRNYRQVILGIAEIYGVDARLIANRIAYGTRVHPASGSMLSVIEHIIRLLYDLTEAIDLKFHLSERFTILGQRKDLLPATAPFACWPNGRCYQDESQDPAVPSSWWDGIVPEYFRGDTYFEETSLRSFLRYMPHFFVGIPDDFDYFWPIPEEISTHKEGTIAFLKNTLNFHPDPDVVKNKNRSRILEIVGDVSRQQMSWDGESENILINGMAEEAFLRRSRAHMLAYLGEVGLQENWQRDGGKHIGEHGIWICLYPSWKSTTNHVPNLVPVIVQNYGSGDSCGTITVDVVDIWLQSIANTRLINGMKVGKRLEDALSIEQPSTNPELMDELCRTALFIEHHPLLMSHRRLEAGTQMIRSFREQYSKEI